MLKSGTIVKDFVQFDKKYLHVPGLYIYIDECNYLETIIYGSVMKNRYGHVRVIF